ncbi:hypothetical protein [Comamonas sp. C11]|uniref:hypothetical protein n=1 Tax=Comamonas sp. C11 TaxID=2966554 RepID=UPI00211139DE|nr:hypothetical protein [Comamonas sp. C11]UUC94470.1 hypothetical protein NOX35_03795 [Comamonas sp. C11]
MTTLAVLSALSNVATASGVAVAAWQLFTTRQQAATAFEDSLKNQYRTLIARIPIEALFGEDIPEKKQTELLPHFYGYFDLCNEQAFLQKKGRISAETWENWKDGITGNMSRPAFARAWAQVAERASGDFEHLRTLCPPAPVTPTQVESRRTPLASRGETTVSNVE